MSKDNRAISCTFFVGGKQVDKLTDEQCERMALKVGEGLSLYYTAHPDEYRQLKSTTKKELKFKK